MAVLTSTVHRQNRTLSDPPALNSQNEPLAGPRRRAESCLTSHRSAPVGVAKSHAKFEVEERGVQCDVDDPEFRGAPLSKRCLEEIAAGPRARDAQLSVATYFSRFDELRELTAWADGLTPAELASLASRFLGTHLCGIRLTLRGASRCGKYKRPICFPERFVRHAALCAERHPAFREALEDSAHQILFGAGFARADCPDLGGENLLRLAARRPGQWGMLGRTAVEFACRLAAAGALSKSMADRLPSARCQIQRSLEAESMHSKRLSTAAQALGSHAGPDEASGRPMMTQTTALRATLAAACAALLAIACCGLSPAFATAACAAALLAGGVCLELFLLPGGDGDRVRIKSFVRDRCVPAFRGTRRRSVCIRVRHVGTTLHPQDDKIPGPQPYCLISVQPVAEAIPNAIQAQFLADYWRLVAGGDHKPGALEARAKEAELDVTRQLRMRGSRGML